MDQLKLHPPYGAVSMVKSAWIANTVCTYKWIIPDIETAFEKSDSIYSPIFEDTSIECYMDILKRSYDNIMYIYIDLEYLFTKNSRAKVSVTFHLLDALNKEIKSVSVNQGKLHTTGLTFTAYCVMELTDLLNRTKWCKSLTIKCEIKKEHFDLQEIKTRLEELSDFEDLHENDDHSDVVLVVEGKKMSAHKCILAAKSSVFAAMFRHDMKENKENIVEINDITSEVMEQLLRFMYGGRVGNIKTIAFDVYKAADKYQLDGLKVICEQTLGQNLNNTNIFDHLYMALNNGMGNLKKSSINYIVSHAKEL